MLPDPSLPQFRLASVADVDLLLDFMREYYAFDGHHYDREAARTALIGLLKNPVFGLAWIVCDASTTVGYIVLCFGYSLEYHGRDAFIDELYLAESHRGRGWGKRTMEFVLEQARLHHVRTIHLEVVQQNISAFEFYRRLGFLDHSHRLMSLRLDR